MHRILVVNPGSTSTKIALFEDEAPLFNQEIRHAKEELSEFGSVMEQKGLRRKALLDFLQERLIDVRSLSAVVGRGGLLRPIPGGVYAVSPKMLEDLQACAYGEHACNLGAILAAEIAEKAGVPAFVVDPVVTDEMDDLARVTGLPEIRRRSVFHALSQRAAAKRAASLLSIRYEDGRFIVAHMGGGISIGAHYLGRIRDVINALDGEGPFSPERAGRLPVITVLEMIERGDTTPAALKRRILTEGGLFAHTGTNDFLKLEADARRGDAGTAFIIDALAYAVAREICSLAPALADEQGVGVSAVVLTGGLAHSDYLVERIGRRVSFLAPLITVRDAEEMGAMASGALAVLKNECSPGKYD